MYLLVTDAHSKWPKIIEMKNTTASQTIDDMGQLETVETETGNGNGKWKQLKLDANEC